VYPITFGYRNWSHAGKKGLEQHRSALLVAPNPHLSLNVAVILSDAGGAQGSSLFDDCDSKLADLAIDRLRIAADRFHNKSQPFFVGFGLRSAHIPYHYPPKYGEMYPPAENFSIAAHPTLDASQPVVGWYDQETKAVQGVATYGDVKKAGGISLHKPMPVKMAQQVRRNYYATTSYSDAQLGRVLDALVIP
jgi:arylsulfatase A-like enzyme